MARRVAEFEVVGPWSLGTSRRFWEGLTPAALAGQPTAELKKLHGVGPKALRLRQEALEEHGISHS